MSLRMLVLTDHTLHRERDDLYPLLRAMSQDVRCADLVVASRAGEHRNPVFFGADELRFDCRVVDEDFAWSADHRWFQRPSRTHALADFDGVLLRMGRPMPDEVLEGLAREVGDRPVINAPRGIARTGTKAFLTELDAWCPGARVCTSVEEVLAMAEAREVVVKAIRGYGGGEVLRVGGTSNWVGLLSTSRAAVLAEVARLLDRDHEVFAMDFLPGVVEGEKRIMMLDGQIVGCARRVPTRNSWLCNPGWGSRYVASEPDERELAMARAIAARLAEHGVVYFGLDTITDAEGLSWVSELNTLNVGGLRGIGSVTGVDLCGVVARGLWDVLEQGR